MSNLSIAAVAAALLAACGCATVTPVGPDSLVSDVTFVAIDVETTGFSSKTGRIVEVAAVRFRGDRVLARKQWLINPGMPIPAPARRVHGISDRMVAGSPTFADVCGPLVLFIGDSIPIAHNARFDAGFISAEFARAGEPAPVSEVIDTLPLARSWFPDAGRHGLASLLEHLEIKADGLHRAGQDAECLRKVFLRGLDRERKPLMTLGQLRGMTKAYSLSGGAGANAAL